MNLPVDPEEGDGEGSEQEVYSEERSKLELPLVLSDFSIKENVVFSDCIEKTAEGEDNANHTEPN